MEYTYVIQYVTDNGKFCPNFDVYLKFANKSQISKSMVNFRKLYSNLKKY